MSLGQQRGRPYSANESVVEYVLTGYCSLVLGLSGHDNGLRVELSRIIQLYDPKGSYGVEMEEI